MSDGAHMGVSAERGLHTIVGGEPEPSEEERRTPEEMRAYIETEADPTSYGGAACVTAVFILRMVEAHPALRAAPVESVIDWDVWRRTEDYRASLTVKGWDDLLKELDPDGYNRATEGITGFMWGWAVNAVRYILGLTPTSNPAIVEVDVREDDSR